MAPVAIEPHIVDVVQPKKDTLGLPGPARERLLKAGIDLSNGYPFRPARPLYLQDAYSIRNEPWKHNDAGARADKSKSALLSAATRVAHLTGHIGTEIEGLQLKDLNDQQRDELALLIAERSVVFFRDQDISPQQQKELGEYYGKVEVHPQVPQVPGVEGVTVRFASFHIVSSSDLGIGDMASAAGNRTSSQFPATRWCVKLMGVRVIECLKHLLTLLPMNLGASRWHSDLVHERGPAGITHLHNDTIPSIGGDTLWASGYSAYEKLSPAFRKIIDGKLGVFRSAHAYLDRDDPYAGPKHIERVHPIVRIHPATGWKSLFVNRSFTKRIIGLDPAESDLILNFLFDVYEKV
jgi:alpha-ketoglutarate-dependent taurine dioxygenase